MKLTRKRGWDFCFIELLFQTQNQSFDEGCSTVGVRQTQTADLQIRRLADWQTCRPADLPFPINFENNNGPVTHLPLRTLKHWMSRAYFSTCF